MNILEPKNPLSCQGCGLASGRTNICPSYLPEIATMLFVAEAPGVDEDKAGTQPLIGDAGKVFDSVLSELKISRQYVGISNICRCLDGSVRIYTDVGPQHLSKIVSTKFSGKVVSFNEQSGCLEWRKVIGWYRSPLGSRLMYKVKLDNSRGSSNGETGAVLTEDHLVLTQEGYVQVKDLSSSHRINSGTYQPNDKIRRAVCGMVLGDGSLTRANNTLTIGHSQKQASYLRYKASLLGQDESRVKLRQLVSRGKKEKKCYFCVKATPYLRALGKMFYPEGKKVIPKELVSIFGVESLAFLYMDDGYLRLRTPGRTASEIATCSFSKEDVDRLIFVIYATTGIQGYRREYSKYPRIHFNVANTAKLSEVVAPYVCPSMRYKLLPRHRDLPYQPLLGLKNEIFYDTFSKTISSGNDRRYFKKRDKTWVTYRQKKTVYCIDVEGNHNFKTTSGVVHNCRPPGNRVPKEEEIKACLPYLQQEIAELQPYVIVALGATSLLALAGKSPIGRFRGTLLQTSYGIIVPTYHPAYILRQLTARKYLVEDIRKALVVARGGRIQKQKTNYNVCTTIESVEKLCDRLSATDLFSVDIETGWETGFLESSLLCVSYSDKIGEAFVVPVDTHWTVPERTKVKFLLRELHACPAKKVGHNIKFDSARLKKQGIPLTNIYADTMLMHHLLSENEDHGLKGLAFRLTDMGAYDEGIREFLLNAKTKDYSAIPPTMLWEYAMRDADATFRLYDHFQKRLKEDNLWDTLHKVVMPLRELVSQIELDGVTVDPDEIDKSLVLVDSKIVELQAELMSHSAVKSWETKENANSKHPIKFNLRSTMQLAELFTDILKLPVLGRTASGKPQMDRKVLTQYGTVDPWADKLLLYRKLSTFKSTFLEGLKSRMTNGRVHTDYKQHVTVTGRLSSSNPNLQNIPRVNADSHTIDGVDLGLMVRNCFISDPCCLLCEADYAQIEFRIWGDMSHDKALFADIEAGVDIHKKIASLCFKVPPEQVTSEQRNIAKTTVFGLMYGRSVRKIAEQYGIPIPEAQHISDTIFNAYPQATAWIDAIIKEAKREKCVKSIFGRVRHLAGYIDNSKKMIRSEAERQSVNSPIQSAASDLTCMSACEINRRFQAGECGSRARIVLLIHDSIVANVDESNLEKCCLLMKEVMLAEGKKWGITIPINIDLKVGARWGELTKKVV